MRKGQEEAPIEILIAVTILTFVLIIGLSMFQTSCSNQYEQKLKASFSKFARDLEFVYLGSVGTSFVTQVDFTPPSGCASVNLHSINLLGGLSTTCRASIGKSDCMQLVAFLEPEQGVSSPVNPILLTEVIDIPSGVTVEGSFGTCNGANLNSISYGYASQNLDEEGACAFSAGYNVFTITKVGNNKIIISSE